MTDEQDIIALVRYLKKLKPKKKSDLIPLQTLARHMNAVGFEGPKNKKGSVRGFSHSLLKNQKNLTGGKFTVHEIHNTKGKISCYDYKEHMHPNIIIVLREFQKQGLYQGDLEDV